MAAFFVIFIDFHLCRLIGNNRTVRQMAIQVKVRDVKRGNFGDQIMLIIYNYGVSCLFAERVDKVVVPGFG